MLDIKNKIPQMQTPDSIINENLIPSFWTWGDALIQRNWKINIYPTENQMLSIMVVAHRLMLIQEMFPQNKLLPVSWLRCPAYNKEIGGAKDSTHLYGMACDFIIENIPAFKVRERLSGELERLEIRMERLDDNAAWCHIDVRDPKGGNRYFFK